MKSKSIKTKNGYVLLFAVLVAALVLGVSTFIVSMARKQFILSSTARESQFAFYNADSVMSCIKKTWFDVDDKLTSDPSISCNESTLNIQWYPGRRPTGSTAHSNHEFASDDANLKKGSGSFVFPGNSCAQFDIWKGPTVDASFFKIVIETRGYNICTTGVSPYSWTPSNSTRIVERSIRYTTEVAAPIPSPSPSPSPSP